MKTTLQAVSIGPGALDGGRSRELAGMRARPSHTGKESGCQATKTMAALALNTAGAGHGGIAPLLQTEHHWPRRAWAAALLLLPMKANAQRNCARSAMVARAAVSLRNKSDGSVGWLPPPSLTSALGGTTLMSLKLILQSALLLVLALGASGCCTVTMWHSQTPTWDKYQPSALYSATNRKSIAIEATLCEEHPEGASPGGQSAVSAKPRYFLIPVREDLRAGLAPTNAVPWLDKLRAACPNGVRREPRDKLPCDYEKVADLPESMNSLYYKRHSHAWRGVALTPLTLAADIATSPIQLILGIGVILTPGQLN